MTYQFTSGLNQKKQQLYPVHYSVFAELLGKLQPLSNTMRLGRKVQKKPVNRYWVMISLLSYHSEQWGYVPFIFKVLVTLWELNIFTWIRNRKRNSSKFWEKSTFTLPRVRWTDWFHWHICLWNIVYIYIHL